MLKIFIAVIALLLYTIPANASFVKKCMAEGNSWGYCWQELTKDPMGSGAEGNDGPDGRGGSDGDSGGGGGGGSGGGGGCGE